MGKNPRMHKNEWRCCYEKNNGGGTPRNEEY